MNVLSRCADFFMENNRHAKAAHLFLLSKDYVKALKMIVDYDVELTSGMIQLFILPDNVPQRSKIMEAVAQHCYDRTQFQVSFINSFFSKLLNKCFIQVFVIFINKLKLVVFSRKEEN